MMACNRDASACITPQVDPTTPPDLPPLRRLRYSRKALSRTLLRGMPSAAATTLARRSKSSSITVPIFLFTAFSSTLRVFPPFESTGWARELSRKIELFLEISTISQLDQFKSALMATGRFEVFRSCKHWLDEVEGYIWDVGAHGRAPFQDKPLKPNDDLMDATRYLVHTLEKGLGVRLYT